MTAPLMCPKCRGRTQTYDRSGITIDQCQECRGIHLDRGELPQLIDAEAGYLYPQQPLTASPSGVGPGGRLPRYGAEHGDRR
jgi:uncharacterized protein